MRAGITALPEKLPGVEVIAEDVDGRHASRQVKVHQPECLNVLLMDIAVPGQNGLKVSKRMVKKQGQT